MAHHLAEAIAERLRVLAHSVGLHRRGGGALDDLPAAERKLLHAMDEEQRVFFMRELGNADAEAAKGRFREQLGRWRARQGNAEPRRPDPDATPSPPGPGMKRDAPRPCVVTVGAGFGGLEAARALARTPVAVTLVDRHNHHLFQPLLYQVATAALSPGDIAWPVRSTSGAGQG